MRRLAMVLVAFLLLGLAAAAQVVPNPKVAEFTPSADHAAITSYEIGWFLVGATDPVSVTDVGKPTPDANNLCLVTINIMPLAFDTYVAKARARAGTVYSEWSPASNPFARIPGPPGGPVVKK